MPRKKQRKGKTLADKFMPESVKTITESKTGQLDQPFVAGSNAFANDRRIRDCGQARELYVRLYLENQLRAQTFAQIRNQMEGGRPFNPDELRRNGESWRTNANFNDGRAAKNRVSLPYWKMVHEVPRKISVSIHGTGAPEVDTWNTAFAEVFDMFLDDWGPDYFMQFSGMADDYVMFGTGHTMHEDESTPRFKWMPSVQVLLPKRTKSNVDTWELVVVKRDLTAAELYAHIKSEANTEAAKTAGWNPEMIGLAIRLAAPGPANTRYFDPNFWQDMIVNNDLVMGGVWPPVSVIDVWAYNPDTRKIRHYILTEKSDVPDYLYEADEEAEHFRDIFGTCFYNVGSNGLYHAIKGFGVMNYYYMTTINRTKCRLVDASTFAMGMNFVKGDNTPEESPPVENYSMVNLFPTGLTQLQFYPQIQAASQLMGILAQNQNENNFTYNEPQNDIAKTRTAKQAEMLGSIANEMSTATSSIFLSQWGRVFANCFKRLIAKGSDDPDAKRFRRRCISKGIPEKLMDLMALSDDDPKKVEYTVKTGASPTTASPIVREQIGNVLMQQVYPLPDANRRSILEFRVSNLAGSEAVNKFLLPVGVASDPRARREAIMENNDLGQGIQLGAPPLNGADPSDSHVEHLDEHLKPLEMICSAVQQAAAQVAGGGGPQITPDHLTALQTTIPHCQGHLELLSTDVTKKQQYAQLKARFSAVAAVAQGIFARLARAQRQAQASGQALQPQDVQQALASAQQ